MVKCLEDDLLQQETVDMKGQKVDMKGHKPVTNTNPAEVDTEVVGKTLTQIASCYLASNIIDHRQTIASRNDHGLVSSENSRRRTSNFNT